MSAITDQLVALANSLGGSDEDAIMAGVAEIERLRDQRTAYRECYENARAEIERLQAFLREIELPENLRDIIARAFRSP